MLVFAAIGGGAAYLFVLAPETDEAKADSARPSPSTSKSTGARIEPGGAPTKPEVTPTEPEATPAEPEGVPEAEEQTSAGTDEPAPSPTASAGAASSPEGVFRRHWRLIDAADYDAAYSLFHPAYRANEGAKWVETKDETRPSVDLDSLEVSRRGTDGDEVKLDVSFVVTDSRGSDSGVCRQFTGWVRLQRVDDRWLYRPGSIAGEKPSLAGTELSAADDRCQQVL